MIASAVAGRETPADAVRPDRAAPAKEDAMTDPDLPPDLISGTGGTLVVAVLTQGVGPAGRAADLIAEVAVRLCRLAWGG